MYNQKHIKNNEHSTAFVDIDETICFYNDENRIYEQAIPSQININKINKLLRIDMNHGRNHGRTNQAKPVKPSQTQ